METKMEINQTIYYTEMDSQNKIEHGNMSPYCDMDVDVDLDVKPVINMEEEEEQDPLSLTTNPPKSESESSATFSPPSKNHLTVKLKFPKISSSPTVKSNIIPNSFKTKNTRIQFVGENYQTEETETYLELKRRYNIKDCYIDLEKVKVGNKNLLVKHTSAPAPLPASRTGTKSTKASLKFHPSKQEQSQGLGKASQFLDTETYTELNRRFNAHEFTISVKQLSGSEVSSASDSDSDSDSDSGSGSGSSSNSNSDSVTTLVSSDEEAPQSSKKVLVKRSKKSKSSRSRPKSKPKSSEKPPKQKFQCSECDKSYSTKFQCDRHEKTHDETFVKQNITCPTCGKILSSEKRLKAHEALIHTSGPRDFPFKCEVLNCKFSAVEARSLTRHMTNVHTDERPFLCEVCSRRFKTKEGLTRHAREAHVSSATKEHICFICGKEFGTKRYRQDHEKRHLQAERDAHNAALTVLCDLCGAVLRHKGSIKRHMRLVHCRNLGSEDVVNGADTGTAHAPPTLPPPVPKPNPEKSFVCQHCGLSFPYIGQLKSHKRVAHFEKFKFQCEYCNYGTPTLPTMEHHMLSKHATSRDFKCDICGNTFKTPRDLNKHVTSRHPVSKDHVCSECGAAFVYPHGLKEHSLIAHNKLQESSRPKQKAAADKGEGHGGTGDTMTADGDPNSCRIPIKCQLCNRKFLSEISLKRHNMRSHGERMEEVYDDGEGGVNQNQFPCPLCDSIYTLKRNLVYHMKFHDETYIRNCLTCSVCGQILKSEQGLKRHMDIHSKM